VKAVFENVAALQGSHSFVAYTFTVPWFVFKWHYHPEYELTLITKGSGKRVVGDSHQSFEQGDLVLSGGGLPHTWSSAPENGDASAVVIQFSVEFISKFISIGEFQSVRDMLAKSDHGLVFPHGISSVCRKIVSLPNKEGPARITLLLDILHQLSLLPCEILSSPSYIPIKSKETENRINKVCGYIHEHSAEEITVEQVADMVHLSKSAFCKFFKRTMKVTFSDYVNEIRIAHACRLLSTTDLTVRQVATMSGFDSLTYFNRIFSRKKQMTPVVFRRATQ
jgi:AraC-like DNA-binding protein